MRKYLLKRYVHAISEKSTSYAARKWIIRTSGSSRSPSRDCWQGILIVALAVFMLGAAQPAMFAQTEANRPMQADEEPAQGWPNIKAPTMGGKQFWTDHCWKSGWRIQQNAITKHWRLLDENNVRHAWGNRAACDQALASQVRPSSNLHSHIVILIHGLIRSADSMEALKKALDSEQRYTVFSFEYASTRGSVGEHAAALRSVVSDLPPNSRISFVGHSMGNIVARHAIGDWQRSRDTKLLERLDSVIMLGPPNQGASIARQLAKTRIFELTAGAGAMELGPRWAELAKRLATPNCPFGIVAGQLETSFPQNPLVQSESSDFVVSVEETKLEGAADFVTVPRLHSFLMDDPQVQKYISHFLQHHTFK